MTSVSSFQGMMVSMSSRNCSLRVFLRYFSKPSVRVGCRMFSDSQRFLDCGIIAKNHRRINQSFLESLRVIGLVGGQNAARWRIEQGRVDTTFAVTLAVGNIGEDVVVHLPVEADIPGVGALVGFHHATDDGTVAFANGGLGSFLDIGGADGNGADFLIGFVVAVA